MRDQGHCLNSRTNTWPLNDWIIQILSRSINWTMTNVIRYTRVCVSNGASTPFSITMLEHLFSNVRFHTWRTYAIFRGSHTCLSSIDVSGWPAIQSRLFLIIHTWNLANFEIMMNKFEDERKITRIEFSFWSFWNIESDFCGYLML